MSALIDSLAPEGGALRSAIRRRFLTPRAPSHLASRFKTLDAASTDRLRDSLRANFFSRHEPARFDTPDGRRDMEDHLVSRLEQDRLSIVPWLDSVRSLQGVRILEIGCGTGASTVALAEQGAIVTGLDVDTLALKDATERCRLYGLNATFIAGNAAEIGKRFSVGDFDMVVFYASLEHMTHEERMAALRDSWSIIPAGGYLGVIDTPNRLWFFDSHTALEPFFNWLPDDVAFEYARLTPRRGFNSAFSQRDEASHVEFRRWGRGVSFHEFRLALDGADLRNGVSCNASFTRAQRALSHLKWRLSQEYRFEKLLRGLKGDVHSAFFEPYLNLTIRKPGRAG
jgi:2-polyprenyl-3-methyl-5-hydroxy-6-metoxy-1,4-benzoquinol methylase